MSYEESFHEYLFSSLILGYKLIKQNFLDFTINSWPTTASSVESLESLASHAWRTAGELSSNSPGTYMSSRSSYRSWRSQAMVDWLAGKRGAQIIYEV